VRNLALNTQTCYVQQVSLLCVILTNHGTIGPEDIRAYQVYLTNEKKLAPGSVLIAVAALRFLYKSPQKGLDLRGRHPGAEEAAETARSPEPGGSSSSFLSCVGSTKHRAILTTCYAADWRISEAIH